MARHTANLTLLLRSLCHLGVWRVVLENGCLFATRFSANTYTSGLLERVGLLGRLFYGRCLWLEIRTQNCYKPLLPYLFLP